MIGNKKECINWLLENQSKIFEVNVYKEKRNKDQNAKYYKLLNQLSKNLKIGVEELHFNMLKNYSTRFEMLVPSTTEIRGIEYFERKSKIVKDNKEFYVYHVYTPSHELKTDEFAILLDGLIQECKQQGIDTRSPDEIKKEEAMYEC